MKKYISLLLITIIVLTLTGCSINLNPDDIQKKYENKNYNVEILSFEESRKLTQEYSNIIPKLTMVCTDVSICEKSIIFFFENEKTTKKEAIKIEKRFNSFYSNKTTIYIEKHTVCVATKKAMEIFKS